MLALLDNFFLFLKHVALIKKIYFTSLYFECSPFRKKLFTSKAKAPDKTIILPVSVSVRLNRKNPPVYVVAGKARVKGLFLF